MYTLQRKTTKIITLIVTISILITMIMPATSVWAGTDPAPKNSSTNEAKIGDIEYQTLEEAIANANANDTITLLNDVEVVLNKNANMATLPISKSIILDGNSHTIGCAPDGNTQLSNHIIGVQGGATIQIKNLTIDGKIDDAKRAKHGIQAHGVGSTAIIDNVTVKNCTGYGVLANGADIVATDLTTEGNGWGGINVSKGQKVTETPQLIFISGNLKEEFPIIADNVDLTLPSTDYVTFGENEIGKWTSVIVGTSIQWKKIEKISILSLNITQTSIEVGNKEQLVTKLSPVYETGITWNSDNDNIAKINQKGLVTAISQGSTTISAVTDNGKLATCKVTVTEKATQSPVTVTISPTIDTDDGKEYFNTEEIEEALSNASKGEEVVITASDEHKAPIVSSDVFQAATETNAGKIIIETKADEDSYEASFEFDVSEIQVPLEVNTKISTKNISEPPAEFPNANTVGLSLAHEGDFPAPATITIKLKDGSFNVGDIAYIYFMNNGKLEIINNGPLMVQENNKITFILSHASDYIISNTRISAADAAASVDALIQKIGTIKYTDESNKIIKDAKNAYDGFLKQYDANDTKEIKNANTLQAAVTEYGKLEKEVNAVISMIEKIGPVSVSKLSNAQIDATNKASRAYDILTEDQKTAVDKHCSNTLEIAKQAVKDYTGATLQFRINEAERAILALPLINRLNPSDESIVKAARTAYDSAIINDTDNIAKNYLSQYESILRNAEKRITKAKALTGNVSLSQKEYVYNGKAKQPNIRISGLKKGIDYKVNYKKNVKIGKATAYITGINDCENLPVRKITFYIAPAKANIKSLKRGVKSFSVEIKKQKKSAGTGYEIAYSTKKGSGFKTEYTKKTKKTIENLKDGKVYYVKVRAYKTLNGKKHYGPYSKIKEVKTYTYH